MNSITLDDYRLKKTDSPFGEEQFSPFLSSRANGGSFNLGGDMDTVPYWLKEQAKEIGHREMDRQKVLSAIGLISAIAMMLVFLVITTAHAQQPSPALKASWYSIQSLKDEGTFKYSKGVMANGKLFNENALTCACRMYNLGDLLVITNLQNNKSVTVRVTDRIGKRFAQTRIDLTPVAFKTISGKQGLKKGLLPNCLKRFMIQ